MQTVAESPFHAGEQAVQRRVGVQEKLAEVGARVIRHYMPDQHREFFAQLPMLLVGSVDREGQPWASVLAAQPGFAVSPDPYLLQVRAMPLAQDPLAANLSEGAPLGLLGIELPTRRRNRMNGWARKVQQDGFEVRVKQSFGNCPKYIQTRSPHFLPEGEHLAGAAMDATALTPRMRDIIARADTYFIATAYAGKDGMEEAGSGVDVSHRGGHPGFVKQEGEVLTAPEFIGNFYFNTTGNIAAHPRAGLLFIDFASGDLLYLAVDAEIVWDGPELQGFAGAERLLRYRLRQARLIPGGLPLRWSEPGESPFLQTTGHWS
jgi:predicted pyridoxine 5'-phosphate oxidase superfamily flavin-nucleotide-binding protein